MFRHEGVGNDNILAFKEVGKHRHTVFISGPARGSYRVAIAIHNRWARSATRMSQSHRTVSIKLLCRGASGQAKNI